MRATTQGGDFERGVDALLKAQGARVLTSGPVDYDLVKDGQRLGIASRASSRIPTRLLQAMGYLRANYDRLIVVSASEPRESDRRILQAAFEEVSVPLSWVTLENLSDQLGLAGVDATTVVGQTALAAAVIAERASIPADVVSPSIISLGRQLRPSALTRAAQAASLTDHLAIGRSIRDRTFLISDLVNFSTIAGLAEAMDLGEAMTRYYRGAREIIWSFGGMVDKFMGDGILAVFDFPETGAAPTLRAVLCAGALIAFGRAIVDEVVGDITVDAPVSGTRVAIANGDAFVADSGAELPEVQFLSQAINRAARIQHSAPIDGLVMERRAYARLKRQEPGLAGALYATETTLTPDQVKGQPGPITVWTVEADAVMNVLCESS